MKVAFIYPACVPTDGGVYNFVKTIGEALKQVKTEHTFEFVRLNEKVDADFAWFLTPHWQSVDCPFAMTVWDLGHRTLAEFPEVSLSGWTWEQRENFYRSVLPRAALVITSEVQARSIYQLQDRRVLGLPMPVSRELQQVEAADVGNYRQPYVLYPAQFWPHKNHITVIDALKILRKKWDIEVTGVFTGADKGNQAYVEEYAKAQDVPVIFPGFVSIAELKGLYLHAHVMVYASLLGPDNLPPLEAMSLGCSVICADYVGARFQYGEACRYFDPLDARHLAQLIATDPLENEAECAAALSEQNTGAYYARGIVAALDRFAPTRRLWGRNYVHT